MITDIKKAIKNISPNNVINIILVLFGVILVLRIILSYFDYQEKAIDIKHETHTIINNIATKTASEIFEYVTDPLTVLGVDHWLAKNFFDLKKQYGITARIIVPPPTGIPKEKWNELNNTHKRVRYWIHDQAHIPNIPVHLMGLFIEQLNKLQHHTHEDYGKHEAFGHDHEQAIKENNQPKDTVSIREYQQILNELDSPLWSTENEVNLDKTYSVETRIGTTKVNIKDLIKIYSTERDTIIEHYITILRSKSNKAQYCNSCHGYEDGKPVLINFYTDTNEKIIQLTKQLKKDIVGDLAWFLGIIFLGMIGSYFLKNSMKELQRSKNELISAKKYIDNIIHSMSESLIVITTGGIIQTVNQAAIALLGYNEQEILGKSIRDIFAKEQKLLGGMGIKKLIEKGSISNLEATCLSKDGRETPVLFSATTIHDKEDNFHGFVCIFVDITQRKLAEEKFRMLSRAVEQSPVSIIITDTQGNIEYVNPKFTRISGYSYDEVIGKNPRILKSGETPEEEYKSLWDTITSGSEWRGVFHSKKKNGELFWESVSISPIKNTEGDITHFLAVKEDITEQLETEKQLTHALKMEAAGQLTSGIAHDFNNLLTIITGNLQLLMEDISGEDNKEMKEILDDVLSAAQDGEELIKRLLLLLRRDKPQTYRLDANAAIVDMKRVLGRMLGEDIDVNINLDKDVKAVFADQTQLESALLNLATNARDAMPNGGAFTIETARKSFNTETVNEFPGLKPGNYVAITVRDTGVGMQPDVVARACEPFYTTKDMGKGTGLGLSMVYNFAKQSGGDVQIESVPGTGTAVTIFLPESTEANNENETKEIYEGIPRGNETILVVEDKEKVRRFAVRGLQSLGYRVLQADNANTAMEILATEHSIALLFSDIVMPGNKNGHELAQWALQQRPELKVVLTTGLHTEMFDGQSIHDDELPLLKKPYSMEQLAQYIRKQLGINQT